MYDVNVSNVVKHSKKNARAIEAFLEHAYQRMLNVVDTEVATHKYRNRTYNAEHHTMVLGGSMFVPEETEITITAGAKYASYLADGGWSRFDTLGQAALRAIDREAESLKDVAAG